MELKTKFKLKIEISFVEMSIKATIKFLKNYLFTAQI